MNGYLFPDFDVICVIFFFFIMIVIKYLIYFHFNTQ